MVSVDGDLYSVPNTARRRVVEVHNTTNEVRILEEGHVIAVHPVLDGRGQRRIIAGHRTLPPPANAKRPATARLAPRVPARSSHFVRWRSMTPSANASPRKVPRHGGGAGRSPIERIRVTSSAAHAARLGTLDHIVQQLERGQISAIEAIDVLLAEEITVRESRRIKAALQRARLATIKTLSGFDFSLQPSLDRNRVLALAQLDFIDRHEVVHFIGQSVTGKVIWPQRSASRPSVPAAASDVPAHDIIDSLAKADREGRLRERIRYLCRASLLIIDEIGYLTVGAGAGNLSSSWSTPATRGRDDPNLTAALPNGARFLGIPSLQPRCSTDCFTTPSSCTSRAPITASPAPDLFPEALRRRRSPARLPMPRVAAEGHPGAIRQTAKLILR